MNANERLTQMYRQAAMAAHADGIRACEQKRLTNWIWHNCKFPLECLYYLVLGIGCELADYEARLRGFENEVERAYVAAQMELLFPSF